MFKAAAERPGKVAVRSDDGQEFRYGDLLCDSLDVQRLFTNDESPVDGMRPKELDGDRVAFLCPPSYSYVVTQWAVWRSGGVCVPLCNAHPRPEMQYVVEDSEATIIAVTSNYVERVKPIADDLGLRFVVLPEFQPVKKIFIFAKNKL